MQVVAGLTVTKKWAGRRARDVICQAQKAAQEKRTLSFVGARSADGIAGGLAVPTSCGAEWGGDGWRETAAAVWQPPPWVQVVKL